MCRRCRGCWGRWWLREDGTWRDCALLLKDDGPHQRNVILVFYDLDRRRIAERVYERMMHAQDCVLQFRIVFDVYDLAKLCLHQMETGSFPARIMDSYPLYLEQPFIIRIAGKTGLYYTEIRKDESGLYVDRYECYARRGDEEILLTQSVECESLLDMKDAAAQYIERFEEAKRYAQTRSEQSSPYLRAACGLSSGDIIRIPGEIGLFYAVVSYYGQFAYRSDDRSIFSLSGSQEEIGRAHV